MRNTTPLAPVPKAPRTVRRRGRVGRKAAQKAMEEPIVKVALKLWHSQEECHQKTLDAFINYVSILNTSVMGAGKTYLSLAAALALNLDVVVFSPASLQRMWKQKAPGIEGINLVDCISYETLIGQGTAGCKHPYLVRDGDEYTPTEELRRLIRKGTLFIFDEVAHIKKNTTKSHAACHAITNEVAEYFRGGTKRTNRSRIYLMSATPYDKKVYTESFLQLFGLASSRTMHNFDQSTKEYELFGMQEIIDSCMVMDPEITAEITNGPYSNKVTKKWCWQLYLRVMKQRVVFSASKPKIDAKFNAYNAYYDMEGADVVELRAAVGQLQRAVRYDEKTGQSMGKGNNIQAVQAALMRIAKAKVPLMARVAREKLSSMPNAKVLLFLEYRESISHLCEMLADFAPRVLNGETPDEDRVTFIDKFQEDNAESRLLIIHPKVGGAGLSLDDATGNFPRFSWYIPTFRFIDLVQSTGRTHRGTTKSDANIFGIYCKQFPHETSMLDSLFRKTSICKEVVANPEDIKFPGEFENYIERDRVYPAGTKVAQILFPEKKDNVTETESQPMGESTP